MKRILTPLLFVIAVGPTFAQKAENFDFIVADVRIMQDRNVQNDMGVTQAQRDKMNTFAKAHTQRMEALQKSLQKVTPTDAKKREVQGKIIGYLQKMKTDVLGVLTPAQLKRLREITLQGYGWSAVADDRVGKRVGMSAAQITQAKKALADATTKAQNLEQAVAAPILAQYKDRKPKDQAEAQKLDSEIRAKLQAASTRSRPQVVALRDAAVTKIKSIMTPAQRSAYTALQGKKYKG